MFVIILNAIFIGYSSDFIMKRSLEEHSRKQPVTPVGDGLPLWFMIIDIIFTCVFTGELLVRVAAQEIQFLTGSDWKWNWFDTVLVVTSVADTALHNFSGDLSLLRVLRLLRMTL